MRIYKTLLTLVLIGFLSILVLNQCHFKCHTFAPVMVQAELINVHGLPVSVQNHQLLFKVSINAQPQEMLISKKDTTHFTITFPTESFSGDQVYLGEIWLDNQLKTKIWVGFQSEGRGCPNATNINTLTCLEPKVVATKRNEEWFIQISI